ncbi:ATP-dependent DNA ligase [Mesorhizobium hawassense]|uniref:ATP-dependent DNA ligase n=1 Tax=Mesorhizobium hawassense TaxID=1209954 RepID=A0A330HN58_9HYPH|nr:RNA ligase family protein [Mesorhizobium hawassense]RAZ89865.1 ATP-dependent DNA ligase [Mesorhizobium hawassense]
MRKSGGVRLSFIPPLLPTLAGKPPEGDGWIHEMKFDGYRSQIVIDDQGVRIFTRSGLDWTTKYRELAKAAGELKVESVIVDGEIVMLNAAGHSDFRELRKAITRRPHHLYFMAFDLMHLNGRDLRDMPLGDRRDMLQAMIPPGARIQFSKALLGDAKSIFHLIDQAGLEGIVSKRKDSVYRSGSSTAWLKTKAFAVDEYDVLGVEREHGKPAFAIMAERGTGRFVGLAVIALNREMRERLWQRVQEHSGPPPKGVKRAATQWVKPGLVGRVKHMRGEEGLRHATLKDFRDESV